MSLSMAVFTFLNAWWISMFLVSPFGREYNENNSSVPSRIRWKKILLGATLLAVIITGVLALMMKYKAVPLDLEG